MSRNRFHRCPEVFGRGTLADFSLGRGYGTDANLSGWPTSTFPTFARLADNVVRTHPPFFCFVQKVILNEIEAECTKFTQQVFAKGSHHRVCCCSDCRIKHWTQLCCNTKKKLGGDPQGGGQMCVCLSISDGIPLLLMCSRLKKYMVFLPLFDTRYVRRKLECYKRCRRQVPQHVPVGDEFRSVPIFDEKMKLIAGVRHNTIIEWTAV